MHPTEATTRQAYGPLLVVLLIAPLVLPAQSELNDGLQHPENPPMQVIARPAPKPPPLTNSFETRDGFTLITSLDELRAAARKSQQRIRMKPGVYRARKTERGSKRHQHLFAITGSDNHFDLRGVVIETPVSVQNRLSNAAHIADTWHVFGDNNTFEGAYIRNVIDKPYPHYSVTENEFEIRGDGTIFMDCTFVIQGSIPFGYSDYYGKGGPNFGRLDKHCFMSIVDARNTSLINCRLYQQSFGHGIHFHGADGVRIENCLFSGALRPTNDIYKETVGRAVDYDFHAMFRGKRPIPRDHVIPLTEDGVRTYGGDKNITVINTTIERMRGCFQIHSEGDVTLENVTVREAGDFAFDVSAGNKGKVIMKNCRVDVAYNPVFNFTRGDKPQGAFYEVTILSPAVGVKPTPRSGLGVICGEDCTFILHDGTTRPLPPAANRLDCGGSQGLTNSTIKNYTSATLLLNKRVRNCRIESVGPVEDNGYNNEIIRIPRN